MKGHTLRITQAATIAALYFIINFLQNLLLPGSTSLAIQFRIAEALCVFALFTPAAIPGLGIGCLLFNLMSAGSLPLDFLVGTIATLLSALFMYRLRQVKLGKYPLLSLLMPVAFNGLIVGWELTVYLGSPLLLNMFYVAVGEAAVMLVLGSALCFVLERHAGQFFGR